MGYVVVIGAANMDILGRTNDVIIARDSNPGQIEFCAGGVGRNIAENLSRLGVDVKMISALGKDPFGEEIRNISEKAGMDMTHCYWSDAEKTCTYLAIMDVDGDLHVAMSDLKLLEMLPETHIDAKRELLEKAEILVLDAGLAEDLIEHILDAFPEKKIFVDTVSTSKTRHIKRHMGRFHTLKANRMEAEALCGFFLEDVSSLEKAGDYFLQSGLQGVFITLGSRGVYYCSAETRGLYASEPVQPVNATGAGDAFMAGIVYANLLGEDLPEAAKIGAKLAACALRSEQTVSKEINKDILR